jgi:hypothetical protein
MKDDHVSMTILSEDDEYWFTSSNECSSYWVDEYISLFQEVKKWCKLNCIPDRGVDGVVYGWRFTSRPNP